VKEKTNVPTPTASDDDMNLLDDDESPLIKDGSSPPASMDVNMIFMLLAEFRDVEEGITQLCLGPKEVMFKKSEESTQYLKPLYVRGHIDRRLISKMLVDDNIVVNLMLYSLFKKLGQEDGELVKTNLIHAPTAPWPIFLSCLRNRDLQRYHSAVDSSGL
jgi:hypothetical protein